jgi:hypothetical protein
MKSFLKLVICTLCLNSALFGQSKWITQKGFILFSESYRKYMDTLEVSDLINFPYITNVFLPTKKFVLTENRAFDNFATSNIGMGLGLELPAIDSLRQYAIKYANKEFNQRCFEDSSFYLVPVEMKYIYLSNNKYPLSCEDSIKVSFEDRVVAFKYRSKEIKIIYLRRLN